jgi:hypothetical protein
LELFWCLCSFPPADRRYIHDKRLHVVSNKWLEDSVEKQMRLPETAYNLKPDTLEELQIERRYLVNVHVTTFFFNLEYVSVIISILYLLFYNLFQ